MITREEFQVIYDAGPDAVYALVCQMQTQIDALTARVRELEARLNKDSHNSSKPPSSDGLKKPSVKRPQPRSLRQKTNRSSGAQPGHPGHTLCQVHKPDRVVPHRPTVCAACGSSLVPSEGAPEALQKALEVGCERRQVFDLPPMRLVVTEHQAIECECPHCHACTKGAFPPGVTEPAQYGPDILALGVYLTQYQLLPFSRAEQLLSDLFGPSGPVGPSGQACQAPCEGTLASALATCHQKLAPIEAAIKRAVTQARVGWFDETGIRVRKCLHWLHVASTETLTYYGHHAKRGRQAFSEIGVLPHFAGVSVHDALASYHDESYPCQHALCNAHLLRELTGLWESAHQTWTQRMMSLLRLLKHAKDEAKASGRDALDAAVLDRYLQLYRRIVKRGLQQNPRPEATDKQGKRKRGRPKRGPARSLLERLQTWEAAILRFAFDFAVPFDNNLAERDLRMAKVRMKISGCFRSETGADHFCRIRGYISTLRKQGQDVLAALRSTFAGELIWPSLQPG